MTSIVLPAGAREVTVREIPRLLAEAIHPEPPEGTDRILTDLMKQAKALEVIPAPRVEPLEDDDWALLRGIWHALPTFKAGMSETTWQRYFEAWELARHRPDWAVVPVWHDKRLNAAMLRCAAEEAHRAAMNVAIDCGKLVPLQHSRLPLPPHATGEWRDSATVPIGALRDYAGPLGVSVRCVGVVDIDAGELERIERQELGRYTIRDAAAKFEQHAGERVGDMLRKLRTAASSAALPMYESGKNARYDYGADAASTVRDFYEEAYWNDLNRWLDENEPRIAYRFPDPAPSAQAAPMVTESVADRNAGWLALFDLEERRTARGAQARTVRQIVEAVGVTESTAKRGIQDAKKQRRERLRDGDPKLSRTVKNTAANPFGIGRTKRNTSN